MTREKPEAAELARLAQAIDTLPLKLRAVWLLGAVDGLDYERIAFRLGLSIAEVERCMARAILRIDRRLCGAGIGLAGGDSIRTGGVRPARAGHRRALVGRTCPNA